MDRVRFVTCGPPGRPLAYLLVWLGDPSHPVVHWVGSPQESVDLVAYLPPRPLSVAGSAAVVEVIATSRGAVTVTPLIRLVARPAGPVPLSDDPRVRTVLGADVDRLHAWAEHHPEPMARGYARYDPNRHRNEPHAQDAVVGAFLGDRVVGAAFASVRLSSIWVINSVIVDEFARGQRLGTALTARLMEAARSAGAMAHLNVRETNAPARRVYARLGFTEHDRAVLLEAKD